MALCEAVFGKVEEQIERTVHLIGLIPPGRMAWSPAAGGWPVEILLGHLLDCLSGFCAVLAAAEPGRLAHFAELRALRVNHACSLEEALARMATYRKHIEDGFQVMSDADLARPIKTVFVPEGEPLLTLFLGNLEHLINHKHQLFSYLREMQVTVGTKDLYRFR